MLKNCVNCGAPVDKKLDKCPYCDTPYEYRGFNADFENTCAPGTISIAGKEYQVYLGECEVHTINTDSYRDINGNICRTCGVEKRKFTLIEV